MELHPAPHPSTHYIAPVLPRCGGQLHCVSVSGVAPVRNSTTTRTNARASLHSGSALKKIELLDKPTFGILPPMTNQEPMHANQADIPGSEESKQLKANFEEALKELALTLSSHVSTADGQWAVKGFIDAFRNVYTISSDTKIVSKILEIHLFPQILAFAEKYGYAVVLAEHQNYYPDISFVLKADKNVKFAVDFKTTYRNPLKPWLCNGFTLGSHGEYFQKRTSTKNIQFPYGTYLGHFCLGIIYDRAEGATIDETKSTPVEELHSITSVISNIQFFVVEKWKIASDKAGSGNTANIGSIKRIGCIISGNGTFSKLGEAWFDEYWMNVGKITIPDPKRQGATKKISTLEEFVVYRGGDTSLIVPRSSVE